MAKDIKELKVYVFDLDGTLCTVERGTLGLKDYGKAIPIKKRIDFVNKLYDEGHLIKIETARGAQTDQDWKEFTKAQLDMWGVKYHVLRVGVKMHGTWYIDDKGISDKDFFHD